MAVSRKVMAAFNVQAAIPAAWELIWRDNLAKRAAGDDFRGNTYFVCAADVENQVRQFADETLTGKPWGTHGRSWGAFHSTKFRMHGDLQQAVRDWLLHNPNITKHNFSRGHISGMRFRPVGEPLSPAEEKTLAKQAEQKANPKVRVVHYSPTYGRAKCVAATMEKQGRRWFNARRSHALTVSDWEDVTCPRCLKLHAAEQTKGG